MHGVILPVLAAAAVFLLEDVQAAPASCPACQHEGVCVGEGQNATVGCSVMKCTWVHNENVFWFSMVIPKCKLGDTCLDVGESTQCHRCTQGSEIIPLPIKQCSLRGESDCYDIGSEIIRGTCKLKCIKGINPQFVKLNPRCGT